MRSPSEQDRIPRTSDPGTAERQALSDRLPRPWAFPLLVFAATWLLILAAWYGSDAVYGRSHPWTWHFHGPHPEPSRVARAGAGFAPGSRARGGAAAH